jgi:hypothetical protein
MGNARIFSKGRQLENLLANLHLSYLRIFLWIALELQVSILKHDAGNLKIILMFVLIWYKYSSFSNSGFLQES